MPKRPFTCWVCRTEVDGVEAEYVVSLDLPREPFRRHFVDCPPPPADLRDQLLGNVIREEDYEGIPPKPPIRCTWGS